MKEEVQKTDEPLENEQLRGFRLLLEILAGIGIALGLGLLWLLELVRDGFFRLLDRLNLRPRIRRRRESAFPPGGSRQRATLDAQQ